MDGRTYIADYFWDTPENLWGSSPMMSPILFDEVMGLLQMGDLQLEDLWELQDETLSTEDTKVLDDFLDSFVIK